MLLLAYRPWETRSIFNNSRVPPAQSIDLPRESKALVFFEFSNRWKPLCWDEPIYVLSIHSELGTCAACLGIVPGLATSSVLGKFYRWLPSQLQSCVRFGRPKNLKMMSVWWQRRDRLRKMVSMYTLPNVIASPSAWLKTSANLPVYPMENHFGFFQENYQFLQIRRKLDGYFQEARRWFFSPLCLLIEDSWFPKNYKLSN